MVTGGTGNDILDLEGSGAAGGSSLTGNDGDDQLRVNGSTGGTITFNGDSGNDRLVADFSSSSAYAERFASYLTLTGQVTVNFGSIEEFYITSGSGDDYLDGGSGSDSILGGGGNDNIGTTGSHGGTDTLRGGAGNDTITASDGPGTFEGGADIDRLILDRSAATARIAVEYSAQTIGAMVLTDGTSVLGFESFQFTGGSGDDDLRIEENPNADGSSFTGNDGNDRLFLDGITTGTISFDGGNGTEDRIRADFATLSDYVESFGGHVSAGSQVFVNVSGVEQFYISAGSNNDYLDGGAGSDSLEGGAGNDTIGASGLHTGNDAMHGEAGNDLITGGTGNDLISDGEGVDTVSGGLGNDIFETSVASLSSGDSFDGEGDNDTITFILANGDVLDLTGVTISHIENARLSVDPGWNTNFAALTELFDYGFLEVKWTIAGFDYTATRTGGDTQIVIGDTADQRTYTTKTTVYSPDGLTIRSSVTDYDDGSQSVGTYTLGVLTLSVLTNPAATGTAYSTITSTYNATTGVLETRDTVYANGAKLEIDYHLDGTRTEKKTDATVSVTNYVTWTTEFDASGGLTSAHFFYDNGNTEDRAYSSNQLTLATLYDTNNNEALDYRETVYAGGLIDYTRIVNDDGKQTLTGGAGNGGNQAMTGGAFADRITGGAGNDTMHGGAGADTILGGTGNDILIGDGGIDNLLGDAGADIFVLQNLFADRDNISDFTVGTDLLRVSRSVFGNFDTHLGLPVSVADWFRVNTTGLAQDGDDRFIYKSGTGELFFDTDGDGAAAGVLVAKLTTKPVIANGAGNVFEVVS